MEKSGSALPVPVASSSIRSGSSWRRFLTAVLCVGLVLHGVSIVVDFDLADAWRAVSLTPELTKQCEQLDALLPVKNAEFANKTARTYAQEGYLADVAELLGGAVRIDTTVYDTWKQVGEDEHWTKFSKLHDYLASTFPLVYEHLKVTKFNTYGLVYHWAGSDDSLKPLMLTAHQDVVPIDPETLDQWIHPPFSGYYDGEWIWGRGAGDQKSGMIGILIAVETLLKEGFMPTRPIVVAFGFDEEASGKFGAEAISRYMMSEYGVDSISLLVDEGGGLAELGGQLFAVPCVGEKGYVDIRIELNTPGGHSSVPEPHTAIGYLSALIATLETNPHPTILTRTNPFYSMLQCAAEHSSLEPPFASDIKASVTDDAALKRVEAVVASTKEGRAFIGTTQAADLIGGGSVKVNALPEHVYAVVNHRISVDSSVKEVKNRFVTLFRPYAEAQNLELTAFGLNFSAPDPTSPMGRITLSDAWTPPTALEPAPVSPYVKGDKAWDVLAGTIRGLYEGVEGGVVVTPGVMGGNTDTQYYWRLTRAIYRYDGMKETDYYNGAHTINEAIRATGLVDRIKFYTSIILNADESDL